MKKTKSVSLEEGYIFALQFVKKHYENFPVISLFLKKELRKHTAVIYQFARQADDIADEGNLSDKARLLKLNEYENQLTKALADDVDEIFWMALINTIKQKNLSTDNFYDLLRAFKQDISKNRYKDYDELLDYCKFSANPVGRIILELNGINNYEAYYHSNQICTALQITNFLQDVSVDIEKGRIYLPLEEMKNFYVEEEDLRKKKFNVQFKKLMEFQVNRTRQLFIEGRKILKFLPFRLKLQIITTIKGGEEILNLIEENNYNVLDARPKLKKSDVIKLFKDTVLKGS
ncbi:MAG: squalene synthase HpnC [Ignavibacteriae bacterium]|nr:MAG: squalene synthase HpnC [Ignavibacteriota bacterium]